MATRKKGARKAGRKGRGRKASTGKKKTKGTWGGARPGAGRPKGSGKGPSPNARRNRVAVMFSDKELVKLKRLARGKGIPVSTLAYQFCARGLGRTD